jgi:hypothetical protein
MFERSGEAKRAVATFIGVGVLWSLISMAAAHGAITHDSGTARQRLHATHFPQHIAAVATSPMTPAAEPARYTPSGSPGTLNLTPIPSPMKLLVPAPTNQYAVATKIGFGDC